MNGSEKRTQLRPVEKTAEGTNLRSMLSSLASQITLQDNDGVVQRLTNLNEER